MDQYEKSLEKMSEMSQEQLNTLIDMQKKRICICKNCSTYNHCMAENKEGLFCFLGKSSCDLDLTHCKCGECPAHRNFQLKYESYCREGSEEEQRSKEN